MGQVIKRLDEIYRLRALKILQMRVSGYSLKDIAREMQISVQVVKDSLDYVKKEKIVETYERSLLNLVPEAIKVYEDKLAENDPYVAKDIIEKMIKLGDRYGQQNEGKQNRGLAAYLAERKAEKDNERTIDGTVIESRAVPATESLTTVNAADFEDSLPSGSLAVPTLDSEGEEGDSQLASQVSAERRVPDDPSDEEDGG